MPVEICRGTIIRLRNQIFEWQRIGLRVAASTLQLSEQALDCFLSAVTSSGNPKIQADLAQDAIELALRSMHELSNAFSLQMLDVRKQNEDRLTTLMGLSLAPSLSLPSVADAVTTAFNMVALHSIWGLSNRARGKRDFTVFDRQIEWARTNNLRICCGPMMRFRPGALPQLDGAAGGEFRIDPHRGLSAHGRNLTRYRGKVHLWNCGSSLNVPGELDWNDEQVLRLAVSLIQVVRRTDPRAPVLLSIDQPWSEYLSRSVDGISPLHFADALIRADLGLSGLALEFNLNAWPDGTLPRDPLEISRMVDRWSMLGLPLMIVLTMPSDDGTDAAAQNNRQPVTSWKGFERVPNMDNSTETIVKLLVAKQAVHAVIMGQATDQLPHEFPHSGLWDSSGKPKSILSQIARLRQQYLT